MCRIGATQISYKLLSLTQIKAAANIGISEAES